MFCVVKLVVGTRVQCTLVPVRAYDSFVLTSGAAGARPFLIQREKVCIYLARLGCVYVLLKAHVL